MEQKRKKIGEGRYMFDTTLTEYTVKEGIEEIGDSAFYACKHLENVNMVKGIKIIGNGAFQKSGLRSLLFKEGLEEISHEAFYECKHLECVTMARGIRKIGEASFADAGIKSVVFKEGLEEIGINAFSFCGNLEYVRLVKGIRKFGEGVFFGTKIKHLEIHEGVEEIGEGIAEETLLETVTLPLHRIRSFNDLAFRGTNRGPPLSSLKILRFRTKYHDTPSIPLPRIIEKDNGQLVRFIEAQQQKHVRLELLLANTILFTCFSLKCVQNGLYNAYGSPVLARIFRYSFRGASLPFPIRGGASKIREWAHHHAKSLAGRD